MKTVDNTSFIVRVDAVEFERMRVMFKLNNIPTAVERERIALLIEFFAHDGLIVEPSEKFIADRREYDKKSGYSTASWDVADAIMATVAMGREMLKRGTPEFPQLY